MDTETIITGFGGRRSPDDYRYINKDHVYGASPALETFPASFHIDFSQVPYLDQHSIGACTCHSKAEISNHRALRTGLGAKHYSARFLYAMSKIEDGIPASEGDCGTYCVQGFKVAVKYGVATENTCPNDTTLTFDEYIFNRNPENVGATTYADADANRIIPGYVQVGKFENITEADIKHALTVGQDGVSLCLPVGSEWWTNEAGVSSFAAKDVLPIRKMVTQTSGHDICITGWETEEGTGRTKFYFRNHWGQRWAYGQTGPEDYNSNGNGWFYYDQHTFVEAWMPSEIPDGLLAIVKALPARANFAPTFSGTLTPGMKGPQVTELQIALKILGTFPFNQPVTQFFGPITIAAVKQFQTEYNVATPQQIADAGGQVGPKSIAMLNTLLAQK